MKTERQATIGVPFRELVLAGHPRQVLDRQAALHRAAWQGLTDRRVPRRNASGFAGSLPAIAAAPIEPLRRLLELWLLGLVLDRLSLLRSAATSADVDTTRD